MGMLVSVNYNTATQWPRRKLPVPLYRIHNWKAILRCLWRRCTPPYCRPPGTAHFKLFDVLWPLGSPGQRLYNILGALTFYGFALVVVTSSVRRRLGHVAWKRLH